MSRSKSPFSAGVLLLLLFLQVTGFDARETGGRGRKKGEGLSYRGRNRCQQNVRGLLSPYTIRSGGGTLARRRERNRDATFEEKVDGGREGGDNIFQLGREACGGGGGG